MIRTIQRFRNIKGCKVWDVTSSVIKILNKAYIMGRHHSGIHGQNRWYGIRCGY